MKYVWCRIFWFWRHFSSSTPFECSCIFSTAERVAYKEKKKHLLRLLLFKNVGDNDNWFVAVSGCRERSVGALQMDRLLGALVQLRALWGGDFNCMLCVRSSLSPLLSFSHCLSQVCYYGRYVTASPTTAINLNSACHRIQWTRASWLHFNGEFQIGRLALH